MLGFVREALLALKQEFDITFVQVPFRQEGFPHFRCSTLVFSSSLMNPAKWPHCRDAPRPVCIKQDDKVTVRYSGNPGYVVGLPLVSGMRTATYPLHVLLRRHSFPLCEGPVWNI